MNRTNQNGKSAKDVAMYNKKCRDVITRFGGQNVSKKPETWQKVPEDHAWNRKRYK